MKILKAVITSFLLLQTAVSFAQTKEETIAWIKEKLEKHNSANEWKIEVLNVSPCEIYFKTNRNRDWYFTYKFNPSASVWQSSDGYIKATSGEVIEAFTGTTSGSEKRTTYISKLYLNPMDVPDINERFVKALNHLATFCEKKKETF